MYIAWTTAPSRDSAESLAQSAVLKRLVACAQVEGPITSMYFWNGKLERSEEYRLTFKFADAQLADLERHVLAQHPYDTPEWIVILADRVGEKYLSWAQPSPSNPPL
jgi:periplasmic divalent cation tolerance protein